MKSFEERSQTFVKDLLTALVKTSFYEISKLGFLKALK